MPREALHMLTRFYATFKSSRSAQLIVLSLIITVVAMAMVGGFQLPRGIFRP
ncbi:MAG: hypothetical protein JWM98_1957 [Thermoleophilia bacterium]|nr:hypothetical protein [Thermoleophilia bacterium]